MSAHTPGPWFVNWAGRGKDGHFVYDEVYVYAPSCGVDDIAVAADIADPLTGEPSICNAQLIAAAPDLLAALKSALSVIEDYLEYEHNGDPWTEDARAMGEMEIDDYQRDGRLETARAAIAKATGSHP